MDVDDSGRSSGDRNRCLTGAVVYKATALSAGTRGESEGANGSGLSIMNGYEP